jgi:cell pole-organizing protein PopZ
MSRTDTTQDSSMEEILASIRRIISEDAAPAPFIAEPVRKPMPAAAAAPRPMDYAAPKPGAMGVVTVREATPPAPVPLPMAAVPEASEDDDILDLDASYAAVTRRAPQLEVAPAAPVPVVAAPADAAPPDELLQPDPEPALDLIAEPAPAVAEPVAEAAAAMAEAAADPVPTAQVAALDISEPLRTEAVPETVSAPVFDSAPAVAMAPAPVESENVLQAVAPAAELPALDSTPEAVAAAEPVLANVAEPVAVQAPAVEVALVQPEIAPALAEPIAAVAVAVAEPVPPPVPVQTIVTEPPAAVVVAALPIAPPPVVAAQAIPRTMEDMVAEMLRPMLRDWLDSNMPRIIEKAMNKPGE